MQRITGQIKKIKTGIKVAQSLKSQSLKLKVEVNLCRMSLNLMCQVGVRSKYQYM